MGGAFTIRDGEDLPFTVYDRVNPQVPFDDLYAETVAFEHDNMVINSSQRFVKKYVNQEGKKWYIEETISFNSIGDIILSERTGSLKDAPQWSSSLVS